MLPTALPSVLLRDSCGGWDQSAAELCEDGEKARQGAQKGSQSSGRMVLPLLTVWKTNSQETGLLPLGVSWVTRAGLGVSRLPQALVPPVPAQPGL